MGRLSKKKAPTAEAKSQSKITGFFQAPKPFTKIGDKTPVADGHTHQQNSQNTSKEPGRCNTDSKINVERNICEQKNAPASTSTSDQHLLSSPGSRDSDEPDCIAESPAVVRPTNRNKFPVKHNFSFKRKLDTDVEESSKRLKVESEEKPILPKSQQEEFLIDDSFGDIDWDSVDTDKNVDTGGETPKTDIKKDDIDLLMEDDFDDDFDVISNEKSDLQIKKDLPLSSKYNRHKIKEIDCTVARQLILILEDFFDDHVTRKAIIKDSWLQTVFTEGDIVHIEGEFKNDIVTITDSQGSIIVNPDLLVSGTSVVSALFCLRKAVLAEMYKGGGGGNKVMLIGTLVHELFQQVLDTREYKREKISDMMFNIIHSPRMIQEMAYLGLSEKEMIKDISPFLHHIQYFVQKFIHGEKIAAPEPATPDKPKRGMERPQWKGRIEKIADIEENIWSPRLGIKGKIDLTVKTVGDRRLLPLELKTGRPSFSAEHAGQVKLYTMMSRDRREDPGSGLLLYLRSSNMVEIPAGRHEERGLIQLRNQLVAYLSQNIEVSDDKVSDLLLPEPIDFDKACSKCDFLDVCSAHQNVTDTVPAPPHPMASLAVASLQHLTRIHLHWFKKWSDMLRLEASETKSTQKVLWTETAENRQNSGNCLHNLKLCQVVDKVHRFMSGGEGNRSLPQIFQVGEVVVVSSSTELALSQGCVVSIFNDNIQIMLDRTLPSGKVYTIDRHVYQASMGSNFLAIGKMLADSPEASKLRKIIIDGENSLYCAGLKRDVAITARGVIKQLNKVQQKAIFRALMAENFCLLRGMPGSGKTTTIVGLIRLLAALGQSVLIVAYTNSAVDTVLCKLKQFTQDNGVGKFLRLGRTSRVRAELTENTADAVAGQVDSCDKLAALYSEYRIIGTTCLATDHAAIVNRKFDWCIVDEASQAILPSLIHPILHANKFILVGDPAQLPPVVQSSVARLSGLAESLFDVLDRSAGNTLQLNIQYRMNKSIADLANLLTYKGSLECANEEVANRTLDINTANIKLDSWIKQSLSTELQDSVVFLDTCQTSREESGRTGSWNPGEADRVCQLIEQSVVCGLQQTDISVIAPYTAQVKYIKELLNSKCFHKVEVGTVDQFQGRDCEMVIYSCTRSFPKVSGDEKCRKAGHILTDSRRLNVAITRAKSKLILIGCFSTLVREYKPFKDMEQFMRQGRLINITET